MRFGHMLLVTLFAVCLVMSPAELEAGTQPEGESFLNQLKAASRKIMAEGATDDEVHAATVAYSRLFRSTLGGPPDGWRREISLRNGVAISPRDAVDCITEGGGKRTRMFVGALREAITDKLHKKAKCEPVNVIEVGSGPYAPVALAMWAFFEPCQIRFTLIDIHLPSAQTLSDLIVLLGKSVGASIRVLCQDGLEIGLEHGENPYDIALAEVTGPALRREPQVQAFVALSHILDQEEGVMIPDSIQLTATLPPLFGVAAQLRFFEISLKNAREFVSTGHHTTLKISFSPTAGSDQVSNLSSVIGAHLRLYRAWELTEGDSQITLSLPHLCSITHRSEPHEVGPYALAFGYRTGPDPGPFCHVTANLHHPPALPVQEVMEAGTWTAAAAEGDCAARFFWKERAAMRHLCEHTLVQPAL